VANHRFQDLIDAEPGLGRRVHDLIVEKPDELSDFGSHFLRVSAGKIDLVDDGDDCQILLESEIDVRHRLRLDPLRRIDDEKRTLARGKAAAHLVREIDVPRRIDQVELVRFAVSGRVAHAHGARFDGDALFPLEIHRVEKLGFHLALGDGIRLFQQPIGEGRFTVVDVRDDRKIANLCGVR
jgi:hypothetical protein